MKNTVFFKKNKIVKGILLTYLVLCSIVLITDVVHAYTAGDIKKPFNKHFDNYKALYNPKQYMKEDIFVIDTIIFGSSITSSGRSSSTSHDYTVVKGNLLNYKIKKDLTYPFHNTTLMNDSIFLKIKDKRLHILKVLRNTINNEPFLQDKSSIASAKFNAVTTLFMLFSIIPTILILLILKNKSI